MTPTYERAYTEYDDFELRARFFSVCTLLPAFFRKQCGYEALRCSQVSEDVLSKEQRDSLPLQEGCKPLFVFYKVRCVVLLACLDVVQCRLCV